MFSINDIKICVCSVLYQYHDLTFEKVHKEYQSQSINPSHNYTVSFISILYISDVHCISISISMLLGYTRNSRVVIMRSLVFLSCLLRFCTCLFASDLQHNQDVQCCRLKPARHHCDDKLTGTAYLESQPQTQSCRKRMTYGQYIIITYGQHTQARHVKHFHDS